MIVNTVHHYTVVGVVIADDSDRRVAGYLDSNAPLYACLIAPTAEHYQDDERHQPLTVLSTEQLVIGSTFEMVLHPIGIERVIGEAEA